MRNTHSTFRSLGRHLRIQSIAGVVIAKASVEILSIAAVSD
jgi:hypothetical protein